jgi:hypothetical protein
MKAERSLSSWRANAVDWIHNAVEQIPDTPRTNWHIGQPTLDARRSALEVLREESVPDDLIPVAMNVTHDHGVQIEWQIGEKELDLAILADGTLEASKWMGADLKEKVTLNKSFWRLRGLFEWLASSK